MSSRISRTLTSVSKAPRLTWLRVMGQADVPRKGLWSQGIYKESKFWRKYLATRGGEWGDDFDERMNPDLPLQEYLEQCIPAPRGVLVRILDVGAGPLTYVGKKSDRWPVEIVAVDPLAETYDKLLARNSITPPVRTIRADAERLLEVFPPNSFDLVSARNCIDHAYDPYRAVEQMVAVAKPGCVVFMHHHLNEARRMKFTGMHQWNFADEGGHFILSSKRKRIDVTESLAERATIENEIFDDAWIVTRISKK